jgi:hypothetical protein
VLQGAAVPARRSPAASTGALNQLRRKSNSALKCLKNSRFGLGAARRLHPAESGGVPE